MVIVVGVKGLYETVHKSPAPIQNPGRDLRIVWRMIH
jgi:hypothetical protein